MIRARGYRLTIAGRLPETVVTTIRARFDPVAIQPGGDSTLLDIGPVDQPALRALLTLLWDVGHDVLDVTADQPREE